MYKILNNISDNIVNNMNIIISDTNNNMSFVSQGILNLFKYTKDELIGKNPSILSHSGISPFIVNEMWQLLKEKRYWNGILKNKDKFGNVIYVSAEIYMDFDDEENHIGYHSIHTNITSSIKNPHKFIFENELFNLFFSDDDDLLVISLCKSETNDKPRLLEISSKFTNMLGLKKDDILSNTKSMAELLSPDSMYYNNMEKLITDFDNKAKADNIVLRIRDYKGDLRFCKVTITPFYFQGNLSRIYKLFDVTTEIEWSNKLDNLNTAKNNFLANFAHEIRTPLNAAMSFISLLQLRENDIEKLDYIRIIKDSSKHLLDLMNDVIDYTAIDNNKVEIIERPFTISDIQSTIEIFYARSLEKDIEFTAYISPNIPYKMAQDVLRIKQIIANLLSNAVKFVSIGGRIIVDMHFKNDYLWISISDNGLGMTTDQINRVFNPFTQADNDIALNFGGTGLGLSVVNEIVVLMGGEISVDSELGNGTEFKVKIPVKVLERNKFIGKLPIDNIVIFAPNFSTKKMDIIKRYLEHFTTAHIQSVNTIDFSVKNRFFIIFNDEKNYEYISKLSYSNKILILKKLNEIVSGFDENDNVATLNMPVLGSNIYDSLNCLLKNETRAITHNDLDIFDNQITAHILVAEDQETNRFLIKEILSKFNISYDIVQDGNEVIKAFNTSISVGKSNYDMLILDMNMPNLSGIRAAAQIREIENKFNIKKTPIIALTANRYNTIDDTSLINMDEYIQKPINLKQLVNIISKYSKNTKQLVQIDASNIDKVNVIKSIRDAFMNNNHMVDYLIDSHKHRFYDEKRILLDEIKNIKFDKPKFSEIYNTIMKLLRKNI